MDRRWLIAALLIAALVAVVPAVPVTAGATPTPGTYVALGDSYAAGPLIPNQVNAPCLRSDHNYASLVAASLGVTTFRDASCSGATTVDMTQSLNPLLGQVPPQFDALTADAGLVSLTIGGNDIGFSTIAETCFLLSILDLFGTPCADHYTAGGTDTIAASIAATGPKVAAVLQGIHVRAPHARVLVVGYPDLLPLSGSGCWPLVPIAPGDLPYLRSVESRLNAMLATEAAGNGATYVDTFTPSIGHDACQPIGVKWIEGILPTSPAYPVHPNLLGMQGDAADVIAALR